MKMSLIVILVLFPFLLTLMPSSEKDDFPSDYNPFSIVIFTPVRIMHTNSILIAEFKKELRGAVEYLRGLFLHFMEFISSFQIKGSDKRTIDWIIKRLQTMIEPII